MQLRGWCSSSANSERSSGEEHIDKLDLNFCLVSCRFLHCEEIVRYEFWTSLILLHRLDFMIPVPPLPHLGFHNEEQD